LHVTVCLVLTGMYGQSSVRLVDMKTGSVIREHKMADSDFGEGLTKLGDTCVHRPNFHSCLPDCKQQMHCSSKDLHCYTPSKSYIAASPLRGRQPV
jgi:hypothetical protein